MQSLGGEIFGELRLKFSLKKELAKYWRMPSDLPNLPIYSLPCNCAIEIIL